MNKNLEVAFLTTIIAAGLLLRIYGLNWDQGNHLHPDERAIVMVSQRINWPKAGDWNKVLTAEGSLNPKFFAYGSFPLYLIRLAGFAAGRIDPSFGQYDKINLIGRAISAIFDLGTVILVYMIAKKLMEGSRLFPLLSSGLYAVSVLPIQLSHFYAVDTILNFFIIAGLYLCIRYVEQPGNKWLFALGIVSGLSLATKFSGIFLLAPILLAFLLVAYKEETPPSIIAVRFLFRLLFFIFISALFTFLFMPYAFIDFPTFKANLTEQLKMSNDPYVFPFTLQYVNAQAYTYPLEQVFLWGLGPVTGLFSLAGLLSLLLKVIKGLPLRFRKGRPYGNAWPIILVFNLIYFLLMGRSAVKFMRYYLPLYPLLAILAAYFVDTFLVRVKHVLGLYHPRIVLTLIILAILIWPLSFISIYQSPNTRLKASNWVYQNVPASSAIATETWDDGMPIGGSIPYRNVELPMNEFEINPKKWPGIEKSLREADYLIISSNRNYRSLQRLTDCPPIKKDRCYIRTAEFYKKLFAGSLDFKEIVRFSTEPKIPILNTIINDQAADESFTVYDHPMVVIFKKQ